MRDRNAPRKRASMKESVLPTTISGSRYGLANNPMTYAMGTSSTDSYTRASSDTSASPASSSSRLSGRSASPTRLLDLYYKYDSSRLPTILSYLSIAEPQNHGLIPLYFSVS